MKLRRPPNPPISRASDAQPAQETAPAKAQATAAATDPAKLSGDVVQNLSADPGAPEGAAGPHAVRAAAMASPTDDVRGFLEDERTQSVGGRLLDWVGKQVEAGEDKVDFVVGGIGEAVDAVAGAIELKGAELDAQAGLMRDRFHTASDQLRSVADELKAWADGEVEGRKAAEIERAAATGRTLAAVADELDAVVSLPSANEMLVRGGSALFRVMAEGVDVFAELAHAGLKGVGAAVSFVGKALGKLLGKDSLRATGINVWGGIRLNVGSKKFNVGGSGSLFFPPLNADDARDATGEGDRYWDAMVFDYGVGGATPAGGLGWSKKGGKGWGVNLFFLSAGVSEISESVFVGIPGVFGVTVGRDALRGSFTAFGGSTPLLGGAKLGLYASHGFAVHTPLLDPVNKYFTRPVAKAITKTTEKVVGGVKLLWNGMRSLLGGSGSMNTEAPATAEPEGTS
jgi:hypothetical protein